MRWLIWLLVCLTCCTRAMSQQGDWCIHANADTLASGSFPARTAVRIAWIKAKDSVWFRLGLKESRISWLARLVMTDSTDSVLWQKDLEGSGRVLLPADRFPQWLEKERQVRLYLEIHPADPSIALRSQRSQLAFFTLNKDP